LRAGNIDLDSSKATNPPKTRVLGNVDMHFFREENKSRRLVMIFPPTILQIFD
jgi:hypothetical protein